MVVLFSIMLAILGVHIIDHFRLAKVLEEMEERISQLERRVF